MDYYFITGTSRGLGKAIAERILEESNSKVIGIGRKSTIINPNYSHFFIDLLEINELEKELKNVFQSLILPSKIVLINNSGIVGEVEHIGNTNAKNIIDVLNVNTIAPAIIINSFIEKYMKIDCPKRIVNISSGAGKHAIDGWGSYCTSKAALDMFSQVVQEEQNIAKSDIKIYSVAPGIVDTTMQENLRKSKEENFSMIQKFKDYKSNNDLISPEEVAQKYWYLLQNEHKLEGVIVDIRHF